MSTATMEMTEGQTGVSGENKQYLTFDLADEHYGVDILKVQEIKGYTAVTKLPNTPDYLKGVLNLRGTIVPIVDLRLKFGMATYRTDVFYGHCRGQCSRAGDGILSGWGLGCIGVFCQRRSTAAGIREQS